MIEILNLRDSGAGSYIVNGLTAINPLDPDYAQIEAWIVAGKEVMLPYSQSDLDNILLAERWALVDKYEAALEVTLPNGHRYAANRNARQNIREEIDNFSINLTTITWIEAWGNFQTDQAELQQVLIEATAALRAYRTLVFGV